MTASSAERIRPAWAVAAIGLAVIIAGPFVSATTFISDDHLFLTFARHAASPFVPFVRDQHGGEYYRPLPMALWWCLGRLSVARLGGSSAPFAAFAFALHAGVALAVAALLRALGRGRAVAATAAVAFLIAPQNLDAAYWFSANTDLLATLFGLVALVHATRGRALLAALSALAAYLSKESAYVLPLLAFCLVPQRRWRRTTPVVVALAPVMVMRFMVLGGWGRAGDERAGPLGHVLQITSGLVHIFTGAQVMPEAFAWGLGVAVVIFAAAVGAGRGAGRMGRRRARTWTPLAFAGAASLPLLFAGWAVGARYFYLPAVGVAWAVAEALAAASNAARLALGCALLVIGGVQAATRAKEVDAYDRRVAAARRAVAAGVRDGHRIFHVDGGIKDLDLAVKEAPSLAPLDGAVLVLSDVPESFALVPETMRPRADMFIAKPPLPPSGGYHFGSVTVVALARRGDEPSLDEVLDRFPDLRFVRLRRVSGGPQVIGRDVTDDLRAALGAPMDGGEHE